jgi:hypothetical protein
MEIVGGRLGSCPKTFLRVCGETATPQARDCKSACQDNRIYYREQAVTLFSAIGRRHGGKRADLG